MDRDFLENYVDEKLSDMLGGLYNKLENMDPRHTYVGDICPDQALQWDDIVSKVADLFGKLAEQNRRII